jgi:hypothetical protein
VSPTAATADETTEPLRMGLMVTTGADSLEACTVHRRQAPGWVADWTPAIGDSHFSWRPGGSRAPSSSLRHRHPYLSVMISRPVPISNPARVPRRRPGTRMGASCASPGSTNVAAGQAGPQETDCWPGCAAASVLAGTTVHARACDS